MLLCCSKKNQGKYLFFTKKKMQKEQVSENAEACGIAVSLHRTSLCPRGHWARVCNCWLGQPVNTGSLHFHVDLLDMLGHLFKLRVSLRPSICVQPGQCSSFEGLSADAHAFALLFWLARVTASLTRFSAALCKDVGSEWNHNS